MAEDFCAQSRRGAGNCSPVSASKTGMDHKPSELSGGEQQRGAIARAAHQQPEFDSRR